MSALSLVFSGGIESEPSERALLFFSLENLFRMTSIAKGYIPALQNPCVRKC